MALQNGVDVKTVSTRLGHYDAEFTLRTYTHATRQKQDEAARTMGRLMTQVMSKTRSTHSGSAGFYVWRSCVVSGCFPVWVRLWVLTDSELKSKLQQQFFNPNMAQGRKNESGCKNTTIPKYQPIFGDYWS